MSKVNRLLEAEHIPSSLWDSANETLFLPASLTEAYEKLIDKYGLRNLSGERDKGDPPVGGITQKRTDQYFAQAFDGSVARAQLALLDPKCDLASTSNNCLSSIAGNRVSITDAPCGPGAAAFSFLSNIAELRAHDALPREPLDVLLIGAELSDPARQYATEILSVIQPSLEAQAIFVSAEFISWDVTNDMSNTALIQKMTFASGTHPNRLLIVANFNAFLEIAGKRKEAESRLTELFRHAAGPQSVALWIEPDMNRAIKDGGLFHWLRQKIATAWKMFAKEKTIINTPILTSSADFKCLLHSGTARVGLAVVPIELKPEI